MGQKKHGFGRFITMNGAVEWHQRLRFLRL